MAYNAELLATFETEKKQLESRISELTQLTEKRKSEIERYKIELRQVSENASDQSKLQAENASVKAENKLLKDKLREISGGTYEPLTDNEKISALHQSGPSTSSTNEMTCGSENGRNVHTPEHASSIFSADFRGGNLGVNSIISGDTWDRHSCRSGAESDIPPNHVQPICDVANLKDKIAMMEETNYSTNEELQATVQELVEMQKTVNELQEENERLADERAVLLASLCAQTQKLENCRVQIEHLKALLLSDGDAIDRTEYEQQLAELVKRGEEERDELLLRQAELSNALAASEYDLRELFDYNSQMRDKLSDCQSKLTCFENADKKKDAEIESLKEQLQMKAVELERSRGLLETERSRSTSAGKHGNVGIDSLQSDKTRLEHRLADVEERLAVTNREVTRLKEQLASAQETVKELDARLAVTVREKSSFEQELMATQQQLDQLVRAAESSQSDLASLRIRLDGATRRAVELENELNDMKRKHTEDSEEWRQFQSDLQMAVVVANNMCVETKESLDRLSEDNAALQEQHRQLVQERTRLVEENTRLRTSISSAEREIAAAATMQRFRATTSNGPSAPSGSSQKQLSVKSLIRSIESQAKTGSLAAGSSTAAAAVAAAALLSSHHHQVNSLGSSPRRSTIASSHGGSPSGTSSPVTVLSASRASPATGAMSEPSSTPSSVNNTASRASLSRHHTSIVEPQNIGSVTSSNSSLKTSRPLSSPIVSTPIGNEPCNQDVATPTPSSSVATNSATRLGARITALNDLSKDPLSLLAKQTGGSKRNALLKWCQSRIQGYNRIEVTNFSSSWADGLAFCALLHSYMPEVIPYTQLVSDMEVLPTGASNMNQRKNNFQVAFKAAQALGIPQSLDLDEMLATERPDWQGIMTYVTAIYKCFEIPEIQAQ